MDRFDIIPYTDLSPESTWTRLGRGSFGCVFKGKYLGMTVAIKEVLESTEYDVEKYFQRECKIMQEARHPNVVQYIGLSLAPLVQSTPSLPTLPFQPDPSIPQPPRVQAQPRRRILIISEFLTRGNLRQYILSSPPPVGTLPLWAGPAGKKNNKNGAGGLVGKREREREDKKKLKERARKEKEKLKAAKREAKERARKGQQMPPNANGHANGNSHHHLRNGYENPDFFSSSDDESEDEDFDSDDEENEYDDPSRPNYLAMPWRLRISFAVDVARAVAYLHARGCMHRDLKGENLLITENERVKVCDFGFARIMARTEQERKRITFCGTDGYMSPEILMGEEFGIETDIFSLGIIFCELASRRLVDQDTFKRHMPFFTIDEEEVRSLASPGCPHSFIQLAIACISLKPTDRPTIRQVIDALRVVEQEVLEIEEKQQIDGDSSAGTNSNVGTAGFGNGSFTRKGGRNTHRRLGAGPRMPSFDGQVDVKSAPPSPAGSSIIAHESHGGDSAGAAAYDPTQDYGPTPPLQAAGLTNSNANRPGSYYGTASTISSESSEDREQVEALTAALALPVLLDEGGKGKGLGEGELNVAARKERERAAGRIGGIQIGGGQSGSRISDFGGSDYSTSVVKAKKGSRLVSGGEPAEEGEDNSSTLTVKAAKPLAAAAKAEAEEVGTGTWKDGHTRDVSATSSLPSIPSAWRAHAAMTRATAGANDPNVESDEVEHLTSTGSSDGLTTTPSTSSEAANGNAEQASTVIPSDSKIGSINTYFSAFTDTPSIAAATVNGGMDEEPPEADEDTFHEATEALDSVPSLMHNNVRQAHYPAMPPLPSRAPPAPPASDSTISGNAFGHRFTLIKPTWKMIYSNSSQTSNPSGLSGISKRSSLDEADHDAAGSEAKSPRASSMPGLIGSVLSRCSYCGKRLGVLKEYLECDDCTYKCHVKCGEHAPRSCGSVSTAPSVISTSTAGGVGSRLRKSSKTKR